MSTLTQKRVVQYDVLRVLTTIMVVISHTHYYVMQTPYGGCDYSALVDPQMASWKLVSLMTEFLNIITMPTFMALGGALFFRSMAHGKYPTLGSLVADKAKRLLVPFLVVGVLYSFPLKLVTGYFSESENVVADLILGQLLIQGNTHLWFLPAMFVNFLLCYILQRYVKIPWPVVLSVLAVVSVLVWDFQIYLVAYPLRFTCWFYGGYQFERCRRRWDKIAGVGTSVLGVVATALLFLLVRSVMSKFWILAIPRVLCHRLLLPAVAAIAMYMTCCGLARTRLVKGALFTRLSRDSFGIYLYSDPLNYVILLLASVLADGWLFRSGAGALVLCATRVGVTLVGALLVTELLRRCKVKYIV